MRVVVALLAAGVLTATDRDASAQRESSAAFLLTNGRLFDGERVFADTQVAVEAGVIRAVGVDLTRWRHLPTIDGGGATLFPGLIDAHVHVRSAEDLQQALRFGVSTVLDMGAIVEPQTLFDLRTTARDRTDLADLRLAGFAATAPAKERDPRVTVVTPPVRTGG